MGDHKDLKKIHEDTRRKGKIKPQKPTAVGDLADVVLELHSEWQQWAEWVKRDIEKIEEHCGVQLAPPPPPPDPW
jgi:hypothetical protein